jgi:DNA-binding transcriptional MerR regulator
MRYKIGDVARILGISADLLRYYEKKGVVTPYKDAHNDYRYYDSWDINFLMDCLWFKNFGFSIEQIADMVRIPSTTDLEDIFLYKEDELRSTIARCQLLLRRSEEYRQQLKAIPEHLETCELTKSPELVRYINRVGNEYPTGEGLEQFARQWLRVMPFSHR